MMEYDSLDRETICFVLHGQFMWHWAMMEEEINRALGGVLGLEGMKAAVISKNINFRDKINILLASVTLSHIPQDKKDDLHKSLRQISEYSLTRNMFAHDAFGPTDDPFAVRFFRTQAQKKVKWDEVKWTVHDFLTAFKKMDDFGTSINDMTKKISGTDPLSMLVGLLSGSFDRSSHPTLSNELLADLVGLSHPPQVSPDSGQDQPTPQKFSQTQSEAED